MSDKILTLEETSRYLRIHRATLYRLARATYTIVLADPSDPRASRFRIKTASGVKTLAKLD